MSNIVIQDLDALTQTIVNDAAMFSQTNKVKILYDQLLVITANIASIQTQITELQTRLTTEQTARGKVNTDLLESKTELQTILRNSIQANI